jgi:hypothetical protein
MLKKQEKYFKKLINKCKNFERFSTFENFLINTLTDGQYATEYVIQAAALLLEKTIIIYNFATDVKKTVQTEYRYKQNDDKKKNTINILFDATNKHFLSLIKLTENIKIKRTKNGIF